MYNWNPSLNQKEMKQKVLTFIIAFYLGFSQFGSTQNLDSLLHIWKDVSNPDTVRLDAIDAIAWDIHLYSNPDSAIIYASTQLAFARKIKNEVHTANALNTRGVANFIKGQYEIATKDFNECLKIQVKLGDKSSVASTLNNLGVIFSHQGNNAKAVEYYTLSLKQREQLGDEYGIAACLGNIGLLYQDQGENEKALSYYLKALAIEEKINDLQGIGTNLSNIGSIYAERKEYEKALEQFMRCEPIYKEMQDKRGLSTIHNNIGSVYKEKGEYKKALDYYLSSLKLREEMDFKQGVSASLTSLGNVYYLMNDYEKAASSTKKSADIAREIGSIMDLRDASALLYSIYKKTNQHKNALSAYEEYIATRDSILSEENQQEIIRQEYKYSYEKMALADSLRNAQEKQLKEAELIQQKAIAEKQQIEIENKKILQYVLFGGLIIVVIFSVFIYNRFKLTQKQRDIIEQQKTEVEVQKEFADQQRNFAEVKKREAEEQKHLVEEKNKEILDSINYAKRIQTAILPPARIVKEYLPKSFILYKPKDIVAGDFYWMESFAKASDSNGGIKVTELVEGNNIILFAACDCTGHGVPGAMVSVICHNALNRSVKEFGLTEPGKILDKTKEIVISEFEKSDEEVKDGMDISLCALTLNPLKLEWAGANNPLWIIRKGELIEYQPDKQPIGKYADAKNFTTHKISLQSNDTIYIFTDGYQDQFGGEKGKKFKTSAMKDLLLSIQDKNMDEQKVFIDHVFNNWKNSLEQIDDVCVIGVRI